MLCKIIPEKCIACGLCQLKAPDVFDYDLDGLVLFKDNQTVKEQVIPLHYKKVRLPLIVNVRHAQL